MKSHAKVWVVALCFVSSACTNRDCRNEVLKDLASPGGKMRAVIFQRDCGGTTGFSTQVSVLAKDDELPDEGGNVFVADTNRGEDPSGQGGGSVVEASWVSENGLLIKHDSRARTFQHEQSLGNVTILYETFTK